MSLSFFVDLLLHPQGEWVWISRSCWAAIVLAVVFLLIRTKRLRKHRQRKDFEVMGRMIDRRREQKAAGKK